MYKEQKIMSEAYLTGSFVVAQDPTIKDVGTTKVANIPGMVVEVIGQGDTKKEIFSYFDLEVWDKAADYISNNCKKGDTLIVLAATPRQNRWENPEGKMQSKVIFRVKSFRVIPKKEQASQ